MSNFLHFGGLFRKNKTLIYFSYVFSKDVPISATFLAEIFLNYPLMQQHSTGLPLLKYVNALPCELLSYLQVLALDVNVTNQVSKMKRDLLKLIGVGEFSDISVWKDPCTSFVIPEVFIVLDIDLLQNMFVTFISY